MKKLSRTEYSLINMAAGLLGYGMNTITGFACRIVFVRMLTAQYLGISGLFTNILSMLSLAELGISSAMTYALYRPIAREDEEKIAAIIQFYRKAYAVIGIAVAAIGLALIPFLDRIVADPPDIKENLYFIYLLYLLGAVLSYFFTYRQSLFIAMQRQYIVSGYSYVVTIVQSMFQMIFLVLTKEYLIYLMIQLIGNITYYIWVFGKAGKDYPYIRQKNVKKLSFGETRDLLKNIKALAANKLSGVLVNSTDNIAITYFKGLGSVGSASNYTLFSVTLDKMITLVFNGLTGSIGNMNASADDETRYHFFKTLNMANFWLYGWAAIGIALVSGDLVGWFYGSEYVMEMKIPLILAVNFYSIGMLHAVYTYKSTLGLFRYGQYFLFLTGLLNLALDAILGRAWGIFGIYCATFLARLATNLWYEPYVVYRYGLGKNPLLYAKRYLTFTGILIFTGTVCYVLCDFCKFPMFINVMAKMILCSIVPNVVFFVCFRRTEEFIYLYGRLKKQGKDDIG